MSAEDRYVLSILDHLSRKLPIRALLRIYHSCKPEKDFIGMYFIQIFFFKQENFNFANFSLGFQV